jgi:hypothetical protein
VSNSSIRKRIEAALPYRKGRQPSATESFLPDTYGWDSVTAAQNVGGAGGATGGVGGAAGGRGGAAAGSSDASQVLQSTLQAASASVTQANKQLTDLQTTQEQLLASTGQNTQALDSNTQAKGGSASSTLSTIGSVASGVLGQGSILSPIISGLMSLFGGGSSTSQQTFTPYIAPASVQLATTVNSAVPAATAPSPAAQTGAQGGTTQVQIQVNAIDSQSFLDHSDEIANAVRQALLNSHSLGDVIAEL